MVTATRQLAAIMFTDMVGYTALMQQNEQLAIQKRDRSKKIFEEALAKYDGKLLMYYGDGTLSIFNSGVNAVKSAIEIQTQNLQEPKIDVRIGLHIGDVMFDDTGIYGDSVNIASRLETLAVPGSVFISEKLFEEIKNQHNLEAKPLGYFELKNVQQPMQVYAVSNPGIIVPLREEVKGKVKQTLNSIAVLPFASLSSDPENEFFCDGMTEELINVLAKVDGLQVTSRTSVFSFKGKNEDVREIAGKLNVQRIIEGSVRKAGNKIRVTAQLINAADGYHFWSETYDRSLEDIFEIQDDIARAIANKMRENLNTEQHQSQLAKASTQNLEAYKKYMAAVHYFNSSSAENRKRAIDLLNEATEIDPNMVDAFAFLSFVYSFMAQSGQMDAQKATALANNYASKAMSIDAENSTALIALSLIRLYDWKWEEGKQLLKRAIEINPSDAFARQITSEFGLVFLEDEVVLENAKLAYRLDPLSANTLGQASRYHNFLGRFEEGLRFAEEAVALDPQNLAARNAKAFSLAFMGKFDDALEVAEENRRLAGNFPFVLLTLSAVYSKMGRKEKADEIINTLEQMQREVPSANLDFAVALAAIVSSNFEKFYQAYDHALEKRSLLLLQCYGTVLMESVWYDERIVESRKKLGLPVKAK